MNLIKSIQLGNKLFPSNLIQGPLAGISCAPFRKLIWQYSQPAFTCTEMISCKTILHHSSEQLKRYIYKDQQEGALCFQLSGNDPIELAEAVKKVTDFGADLIDLNCGCPVKKIRSKGAGSSLLMNSTTLFQLISAMKNNTTVPVSIKIRVEGGSTDKFNEEIVHVVRDAGTDFLVVHGRHWTEHYETPCHYDDIQYYVESLKIPVIGNGDIRDAASLQTMFATGCAGVMISRAGMGQPWLIGKLTAEMAGNKFEMPSNQECAQAFLQHVRELMGLMQNEKSAIMQARQFAKYYARQLPNRMEFAAAVNQCESLQQVETILPQFFQ